MKTRKFTRYSADISISIAIDHMIGEHQLYVQDISQGGLCLKAHGGIDRNTHLNLKLSISGHSYDTRGKIVWCKPLDTGQCQMGIKFDKQVTQYNIERIVCQH